MKKFVSILLALALILSLSTTAFAEGEPYEGHLLLSIQNSTLKDTPHAAPCDGTNHVDSCYNYTYIVNETYREILQGEVFTNNSWEEGETPADVGSVTDAQILSYLAAQTGGDYGTLRTVAERIYTNIKDEQIAGNAMNETGNVAAGYWLFADVRNLDEQNLANSLIIVDSHRGGTITITPKTGLPTLVKKVKDINDTTGVTTDWQDSADHDINDTVDFQLTATMPENIAGYDTYKIVFHDTLSAGLTLKPDTIKVMVGETDVTDSFDTPETATSPFEISCEDILSIEGIEVDKDTKFVVTYSATLNENAVIGAAGNPNTAYLEFSNNPYDEGTGKTKDDTVIVFTYQLTINKTDADKNPLAGAGFTLYKKNTTGTYVPVGNAVTGTGESSNIFEWTGLDDGDYKLVETTVPAGYNKMENIEFAITAEHDTKSDAPSLTKLDSTLGTAQMENGALTGVITDDIVNQTGTVLPETGAKGTVMLITISTMFVMVAAVFMVVRKKMSIYED